MKRFASRLIHIGRKRGFTLYYAALFGSIILVVGASMLGLTLKEFLLSSSLEQSEYAFFAADSGTECALYWDTIPDYNNVFPDCYVDNTSCVTSQGTPTGYAYRTMTPGVTPFSVSNPEFLKCDGGKAVNPAVTAYTSTSATTTFQYQLGPGAGSYCVTVDVGKQINPDQSVTTTIFSRGNNLPCSSDAAQKVERAIYTVYPHS